MSIIYYFEIFIFTIFLFQSYNIGISKKKNIEINNFKNHYSEMIQLFLKYFYLIETIIDYIIVKYTIKNWFILYF